MTTPVRLEYPDAVGEALRFLRSRPELAAVSVASRIPDTGRSLPFVWCRRVGGFLTGRNIEGARIDLHVYHRSEKQAHDLTQTVRSLLIAWPLYDSTYVKAAREFSGPGPVPDPLWPEASRFYFTVELTLRGYSVA